MTFIRNLLSEVYQSSSIRRTYVKYTRDVCIVSSVNISFRRVSDDFAQNFLHKT